MNAGLIKEWCPKCATKLDVVTVRECQQHDVTVKVLALCCPNVRCGFSIQDFDVVKLPARTRPNLAQRDGSRRKAVRA